MRKKLTMTVALLLIAVSASAKNLYIPVVGRVAGANQTYWRTDVRIFNPSPVHDIYVSLHFLPQGIEGTNISGILVTVPKRQMIVLNDIVGSLFKMESGLGALRLDSDTDMSYSFAADARTYTNSERGGTFGQFIPALDPLSAKNDTVVLHVAQDAAHRTNAGVMNPGTAPAQVTAFVVAADGTLMVPEVTFSVPPKSMLQSSLPAMFGLNRDLSDGFLLFKSTEPVFTWGSVVDNASGDPVCILGAEDKAEVTELPLP
jgi:hypothetical protein